MQQVLCLLFAYIHLNINDAGEQVIVQRRPALNKYRPIGLYALTLVNDYIGPIA